MSIAEQLLARLTTLPDHPNFVGAPIDLTELDAEQLGIVWPAFRKAQWLDSYDDPRRKFASWLREQLVELEISPLLDENAGLEVFRNIQPGYWRNALDELPHLAKPSTDEIKVELVRIMGKRPEDHFGGGIYEAYVMGYFAGGYGLAELRVEAAKRLSDSPFGLNEFNVLPELGKTSLFALVKSNGGYFISGKKYDFACSDPAVVLSDDPAYLEFAENALISASQRIADIQGGKIPYEADGAFTTYDAQVISRVVRIASYRDDVWLRRIIGPLLTGVCVAPTSAKTAPSQSLAITLGHSIEEIPTPESVRALRDALAVVRHAGVKKKLSRNLKPAERSLGERPAIALRMTQDMKPDKKQQMMLATCMESGFFQEMLLSYAEWRERLVDAVAGIPFTTKVVWVEKCADGETRSFMVESVKDGVKMFNVDGKNYKVDSSSSISLWHPLLASDQERRAWQKIILSRKIKQPIRQVFREYYIPRPEEYEKNETLRFGGHILSIRTLIGLARREGWTISNYEGLSRQFGDIRVTFDVAADLYPGAIGEGATGQLFFFHKKGNRWAAIQISQLNPVVFSEIARSADLLVSVAGFGIQDERSNIPITVGDLGVNFAGQSTSQNMKPHPTITRRQHLGHLSTLSLGVMAHNRKNTLSMVFAKQIDQGTILIDEHHLRIGEYAVHLATARVTKSGEPCELEPSEQVALLNRAPWLPYDEVLLQRIVDMAVVILGLE